MIRCASRLWQAVRAGVLVLALVVGDIGSARGQVLRLEVVIEPVLTVSCPTAVAVVARLDAYLAESEVPAELSARLAVRAADGGFAADIELRRAEPSSTRSIAGARCAEVLEAAVLVIAIAVDPLVMDRAPPAAAALDVPTEPTPPPPELSPEPLHPPALAAALDEPRLSDGAAERTRSDERAAGLDPPRVPASPPTLVLRLGAAVTLGSVPSAAPGTIVEIGIRADWLEARVGLLWASETGVVLEGGRGGSFALYTAILRLGAVLAFDFIEVVPRLGVSLGAMTGRGTGVLTPRSEAAEWIDGAGGIELRVRLALGPLELSPSLSAELLVPFLRPRFVLNAEDDVFTPPELGGALVVGLGARVL